MNITIVLLIVAGLYLAVGALIAARTVAPQQYVGMIVVTLLWPLWLLLIALCSAGTVAAQRWEDSLG